MTATIKEFGLAILAAVLSVAVFWIWRSEVPLIAAGAFENYRSFIVPAIALGIGACVFSLASIFVSWRSVRYAFAALPFLAAMMFFPPQAAMAGVCAAAALLGVFAARRMRAEYESSLAFSTSKILKAGLPIYFTAVSLVIALLYYQEVSLKNNLASSIVPHVAVDLSLRFLTGAVSDLQGTADANSLMTVDEFLAQNLEGQLKEQGTSLKSISQRQIAEIIAGQRNELAKRYGIQVKGGERLADVLHRTITSKVEEILGPYARFLPFLSALTFFFALRVLTFPLYFVVVVVVALLITLLHAVKIIKSEKKQIEVERLIL
ncbi:MAG: hypothetical protein HYT41_00270 [Candidatus Sungbacteria bacterium]|nr:hypothetical protein [Candidatus Sungbacteria bacterium]